MACVAPANQGASYGYLFDFLHMKKLYWLQHFYAFMPLLPLGELYCFNYAARAGEIWLLYMDELLVNVKFL